MLDAPRRIADRSSDAAALRAALRLGELELESLRLAAWLGHEPALEAISEELPPPPPRRSAWTQRLARLIEASDDLERWVSATLALTPAAVPALRAACLQLARRDWEALSELVATAAEPHDATPGERAWWGAEQLRPLRPLASAEELEASLRAGLLAAALPGAPRPEPLKPRPPSEERDPITRLLELFVLQTAVDGSSVLRFEPHRVSYQDTEGEWAEHRPPLPEHLIAPLGWRLRFLADLDPVAELPVRGSCDLDLEAHGLRYPTGTCALDFEISSAQTLIWLR